MSKLILRVCAWCATALTLLAATPVAAQPLGTFSWQLQPHCNVVTLTVTQLGSTYRLEGTDNLCGAAESASAQGVAFLNPAGNVGFGLTIVAPGAAPIHVAATISATSLSGSWQDDAGNGGTFAFNGAAAGTLRPTSNQTRVVVAHTDWRARSSAEPMSFMLYSSLTRFQRTSTGSSYLVLGGSVPVTVNGRQQQLMGLELCYQASASASLSYVEINTATHTAASPTGRTMRLSDGTEHTDATCRYYGLATPYVLSPSDSVNAFIGANWTVASANFDLGRATWVLQPTTSSGVVLDPTPDEPEPMEGSPTSAAARPGGR